MKSNIYDFRKRLFDKSDIYTRLNAFSYIPDLIKALQPKIDITKKLINLIYDINNVLDALVNKVNIFLSKEIQAEKSLKLFQPNYTRKPSRATINKEIKRMRNIIDTYKINDKLISKITGRGLFSDLPIKASDIKQVENDILGIGGIINRTIKRLNIITQGINGLERDNRVLYKGEVKKLINNLIKSEELINKLLDNFLKQNDNFDENVFKSKQSKKKLPAIADKTKSEYSLALTPLSKTLSEVVSPLTKSEQRKQISDYFLRFSQPTKKELKEIRTYIYITNKIKNRNELNEVDGFNIRFDKFINIPLLMHALNYNMDNNSRMKFLKGYNKLINDINHVIDNVSFVKKLRGMTDDAYDTANTFAIKESNLVSSDMNLLDIQKKYYQTYYRLQPLTAKMRIADVSSADGRIMRDMFKELNILLDKFIKKNDYYGLPSITSKTQVDNLINKSLKSFRITSKDINDTNTPDFVRISDDDMRIYPRSAFAISNAKKAVAKSQALLADKSAIVKQQAVVKQLKPLDVSQKLTKGKLVIAKLADKSAITKPPVKPLPLTDKPALIPFNSPLKQQNERIKKEKEQQEAKYKEQIDVYKQYNDALSKMNSILFNSVISGEVYSSNDIHRMITFFKDISNKINELEKNIRYVFKDSLINQTLTYKKGVFSDSFEFLVEKGQDVRDSIYGLLKRVISFLPPNKQKQFNQSMDKISSTFEWN